MIRRNRVCVRGATPCRPTTGELKCISRNGPDHQMGRGHRGLCHGSEERARRAFLRPQARLGKLSLLLFGKRIRSQADSRQGRGGVLRSAVYGPLSLVGFPEQITDDPKTWDKVKPKGDLRGLPTAIVYNTKVSRPITPVYDLMKEEKLTDEGLRAAVNFLFEALTFRPPTLEESNNYLGIVKDSVQEVGKENGVFMGLSAVFLDRDALFRPELVRSGKPDGHGRIMLRDWELGLALNHALSYVRPDETLRKAIADGRMRTREDVKRELVRNVGRRKHPQAPCPAFFP